MHAHTCGSSEQICYSIACTVSIIALASKIMIFRAQMLRRRFELERYQVGDASDQQRRLKKHSKKLLSTDRSIQLIYTGLLVGVFEGLPLGMPLD